VRVLCWVVGRIEIIKWSAMQVCCREGA